MKLSEVLSSDFPEIDDSVKECVNRGQWLLFKSVSSANPKVVPFYLEAEQQLFELDISGKIVRVVQREEGGFSIDEIYYFSDMPHPTSLSNLKMN